MFDIERCPGRPCYQVDSTSFFDAEPRLLTNNTTIVDHSESFFLKFLPPCELQTTNQFTAPEVLFGWSARFHLDMGIRLPHIWDTCWLSFVSDRYKQSQIVELLERVPSSWNHVWLNEGYLQRDGCKNPVNMSTEIISYPLREQA